MTTPIAAADHAAKSTPEDEALFSKVSWHLLPLLTVCYLVAFLDRINISFAQLQMKQSLSFSDEAYAVGASIFFVGYLIFEIPSNLILERIGARKTLLRILFCWGIVASAMMYVHTEWQFYLLRFLLGAFEAGFFPGVILYLTYWYPSSRRGRAIAIFMAGSTIAYIIAGPMSGAIMKFMDGMLDHRGWQWLFLIQGIPASFLGLLCYFYLKDKPEQAEWLTDEEKERLRSHVDSDAPGVAQSGSHGSFWTLLRDPKIYSLVIVYMLLLGLVYAMIFWAPVLIKSWGVKDLFMIGILAALPSVVGIIGMILLGRSSDKFHERRWHFAIAVACCTVGLLGTIFMKGALVPSLIALAVFSIGSSAATPIFFTAVSEYLPKSMAAGGIALVSCLGNFGPAIMPPIVVKINTLTAGQETSLYLVAALYVVAGALMLYVMRPARAIDSRLAAA
ncbi:MAG: MFS transporter [Burkholderiaceae bacterium]|nr:MAG: MFS transporter [Burkholderiaceae bacterium]